MTAQAAPARSAPRASPPAAAEAATPARRGAIVWLGRHWWALLLLVGTTWGFLWPYSRRPWSGLASWGDPVQQYWSMAWAVHALRTDPTQLFNGNIFYPYPNTLAYADHLLGATIPVLPIILLTGNVVLGFNLAVLFAFFLSALGAYLLVADLTGSRLAGIAAALPFAFSPYLMGQLNHLNVVFAGPIALAVWATLRLWRGGGWRWAALLVLAIPWEAGVSAYFFYAQLIGVGTTLGYLLLAERRALTRGGALRLGVGLVIGLLAAVPVLWPYLQITREFGTVRSLDEVVQWSGVPRLYLGINPYNFTWSALLRPWSGGNPERFLFPGLVAPLLALAGLIFSRRRERWLFAALIAVGFILTLGPYHDIGQERVPMPYLLLYRLIPGFSGMRVTTRFVILVILGLAGLAGLAVEALVRRWQDGPARRRKRTKALAAETSTAQNLTGAGNPPQRVGFRGAAAPSAAVSTAIVPTPRPARPRLPVNSTILGGALLALLLGAYTIDYRTHSGMTGSPNGAIEAPAYGWLAQNGRGPVAEFPYPPIDQPQTLPDLIATAHWRPIVGGFSGFEPPAFSEENALIDRFPEPEAVEMLQGLEVEHVLIHRADIGGDRLAAMDRLLQSEPRVREVARFDTDVIYALAADPWLPRLAATVPAGEAVVMPDLAGDGLRQQLLTVYLRRAGHTVWGSGAVSYHQYRLPDDGALPPNAVLPSDADPYLHGWLPEEAVANAGGLTLYHHAPTTRAASLLNDQALPRATCPNCAALGFQVNATSLTPITADKTTKQAGGSTQRSALIAFVNTVPGKLTIQIGDQTRQEDVQAGLIVYRVGSLPTPTTIRIDAPPGGALTPRWSRLEEMPGAATQVVATRPIVMVTGQITDQGDGKMALAVDLFTGAGADQTPYALSLDIYRRPYGTHPDGHYGYWTIGVPANDQPHRATMNFAIATRAADATLDGNWASIASWGGPPIGGSFRASLVVARGDTIIGSVPAFEFELRSWQARYIERTLPNERVSFFPPAR